MTVTRETTTILLFGDQTDAWVDSLDRIFKDATSTPWLQSFLTRLSDIIKNEAKQLPLDQALKESLGWFTSLQELGERYRHSADELGVVRAILLHTVRSATMLQWAKCEPSLLGPGARSEWLGISGGLLSLTALAVADDFESLQDACLDVTRVVLRLCKLTSVRSRAVEDQSGIWGWAILGISGADLKAALEDFQQSMGIPPIKRAKVAITGPGWNTVIGPPSVLKLVVQECPVVRPLAKNPLEIKALQHTLQISSVDVDFIVGNDPLVLNRPTRWPNPSVWGMVNPHGTYSTWGELLRTACREVLSQPLDIAQTVEKLVHELPSGNPVRIVPLGPSSHTPHLASVLQAEGHKVSIHSHVPFSSARPSISPTGRVAIVGMSGRGPGGDNADELWEQILAQQDLCTEVPPDRFDVDEYYCPEHGKGHPRCTMTTRFGCFMKNPGHFDARFFHISPREAMLMDPGHRQFLMCTYEALEMAGYSDGPTKAIDPHRIASFLGQCTDDWHDASHPTLGCDAYTLQGVQRAFGPGRLAWHFKWEGPTYSLDAACASSTGSIHLACMNLLAGEIDMAVAGATNILNYPHSFTCLSKSGVLSDTGNCKPFRDDADGYCRADFVGAVVLKRLEDAVANRDNILAVVAGSGRNHSGNSTSITTSDPGAQERLFRNVLRKAQVSPAEISYVEMHGTGTPVGDPAEMTAVANTFKQTPRRREPLRVGGVKANFGHSEAAAGMAELLKCIMMFQKDVIPPQAGMPHALNPRFPALDSIDIDIPSKPHAFSKTKSPRRILLNNFDAAGGNACMVLEDYIPTESESEQVAADPRSRQVIVTSARTLAAYHANKRRLAEWVRGHPEARLKDLAYTTTARRMHHPFRFSCAVETAEELISQLEAPEENVSAISTAPSVVFVFAGQGSHYAGMGSELYHTSPVFRESVDLCVSICLEHGFPPFLDLFTNVSVDMSTKTTVQTQLAVLTLEIALARFWQSVGIQPAMVIGHSLGEFAALHVAGVLSLADVLYLVGQRALLLSQRCQENTFAMLSVNMPVEDMREFLSAQPQYAACDVACINSPKATVISGGIEEISQIIPQLKAQGMHATALSVPYGFHSLQMDPILADYANLAECVTYSCPAIPVASTLLSKIVDAPGTFSGRYLSQQTRRPVDFVGALHAVMSKVQNPLWMEIGPSSVCSSFVRASQVSTSSKAVISTLEGPGRGSAWESIAKCLMTAYKYGAGIDWLALHAPYQQSLRLLTLPSYAWDLKDYWVSYTDAIEKEPLAPAPVEQRMISTCAQYVSEESSSTDGYRVTLRASLAEPELRALIEGHRMQEQSICPGSVFCEAAVAASLYALEANGRKADAEARNLAIRNPVMTRPLTNHLVGPDGELLTTVSMTSATPFELQVTWKASPKEGGPSYNLGSCTLTLHPSVIELQARWDRISYFIKARMDEVNRAAQEGRGHRFQPDIFYALFAPSVQYDDHFKGISWASVTEDFSESTAEIVLGPDPPGARFAASPYWGEKSANLAGFTVNANPRNQIEAPGTSFINSGFDSFEQTLPFQAGHCYRTYVRVTQVDAETRSCEVFIFDDEGRLMAQCAGLKFRRIPNAMLRAMLSGNAATKQPVTRPPVSAGKSSNEAAPTENPVEPIPSAPLTSTRKAPDPASTSSPNAFQVMLESIAHETGVDIAELTDDAVPAELGVDSIMAIEVTSTVSSATGLDLLPSFLMEHPTIGDLRRALSAEDEQSASATVTTANATPSSTPSSEPADSDYVLVKDSTKDPLPVQGMPRASVPVEDNSPLPTVRTMLLKDGPVSATQPPFFIIADGTGSIGSYIHLPAHLVSNLRIYGIDSPYLRCPSRLTPEIGIPGAAEMIVSAILSKLIPLAPLDSNNSHTAIPFWLGGFSGGAMLAYEVSRQLAVIHSRPASGLLLIDMCAPRRPVNPGTAISDKRELGLAMFDAIARANPNGLWRMTDTVRQHLTALFACVAAYHPDETGKTPPVPRTAIIWARRGMLARCKDDPELQRVLREHGIPTKAYPGFMEDPKLGAVGWSLVDKTENDLGPNGWERFLGDALHVDAVDGDHLDLPSPGFVQDLAEKMERAFEWFKEDI